METETQAPAPLIKMALVLDKRVTENGLPGLSVFATVPGEEPRKKTTGPFMTDAQKKEVVKLLEQHKAWEAFETAVTIGDILQLKNPFPDIRTPSLSWTSILAHKTWTAVFRTLQIAGVLKQHRMLCGDYLVKAIDHLQRNRDEASRKQGKKFNYILCEPGLPLNANQLVSDALGIRLLTPEDLAPKLVVLQPKKEEPADQKLILLGQTSADDSLKEKVQDFLNGLPPEQQAAFLEIQKEMAQNLETANRAVAPTSQKVSFSSIDQLMEDDPQRAIKTLVKSNLVHVSKPSADRNDHNGFIIDTDNWKPEYNFLEFMIESIPHHKIKSKKAVQKYTIVKKFLIKYFKRINTLQYDDTGKPYLSFAYLAKPPIKGKPATLNSPEIKPEPGVLETMRLWMKAKPYSTRTINDYIGLIKAIMKRAKDAGLISDNYIPVGRDKEVKLVQPPPLKRTVDQEKLEYIFKYQASTHTATYKGWSEALAKLIWIIGFTCFGMPPNEIFRLTKEQLEGAIITYYRNKRKHSEKRVPITVPVDDYIRGLFNLLIKMLGGPKKDSPYAIPGLELTEKEIKYLNQLEARNGMTKEQVYEFEHEALKSKKIQNINVNINEYFKKIITGIKKEFNVKVDFKVTTYMLRHAFVTWAKDRYDLLTIAREMLGHEGGTKTLEQNYGFDDAIATKNEARAQMHKSFDMQSLIPGKEENKEGKAPTKPSIPISEELPKAS